MYSIYPIYIQLYSYTQNIFPVIKYKFHIKINLYIYIIIKKKGKERKISHIN